jgi:hypothetical protein
MTTSASPEQRPAANRACLAPSLACPPAVGAIPLGDLLGNGPLDQADHLGKRVPAQRSAESPAERSLRHCRERSPTERTVGSAGKRRSAVHREIDQ